MFLARLASGEIQKIFTGGELDDIRFYVQPTIHDNTPTYIFDPDRSLANNEWHYITLNDETFASMVQPYYDAVNSTADLPTVDSGTYASIIAVYRIFGNNENIIWTSITDRFKLIRNKKIIRFIDTHEPQVEDVNSGIEFPFEQIDAFYRSDERKLYFKNYQKIRKLFSGIEYYFSEATIEEIRQFFEYSIFDIDESVTPEQTARHQRNARYISAIMKDSDIALSDSIFVDKILHVAQNFTEKIQLNASLTKIQVASQGSLNSALNLLLSRYYISPITDEKMESYGSTTIN